MEYDTVVSVNQIADVLVFSRSPNYCNRGCDMHFTVADTAAFTCFAVCLNKTYTTYFLIMFFIAKISDNIHICFIQKHVTLHNIHNGTVRSNDTYAHTQTRWITLHAQFEGENNNNNNSNNHNPIPVTEPWTTKQ